VFFGYEMLNHIFDILHLKLLSEYKRGKQLTALCANGTNSKANNNFEKELILWKQNKPKRNHLGIQL
jgi:hypothetical protein